MSKRERKQSTEPVARLECVVRDVGVLQTREGDIFALNLPFIVEHLKEGRIVQILVWEAVERDD